MIRPFNPVQEVLLDAGILKNQRPTKPEDVSSKVQDILNGAGASLNDAAEALASGLAKDNGRISAARLIFELHGALRDAEKPQTPIISIQINNSAGIEKNLLQFITPSDEDLPLVEDEIIN